MVWRGFLQIQGEEVEEEDDMFFDSRDDLSWVADSSWGDVRLNLDTWISSSGSVDDRRDMYIQCMDQCDPQRWSNEEAYVDGTMIRRFDSSNAASSMSGCSSDRTDPILSDFTEMDNISLSLNISDDGTVHLFDSVMDDSTVRGGDTTSRSGRPSSVSPIHHRQGSTASTSSPESKLRKGRKMGWLKRLGVLTCFVDKQSEESNGNLSDSVSFRYGRTQRVKVRSRRKRVKEFSAVYRGQDIKAHDGAILTMKFSCDGHYLASGGEDGVVRVWHVMECDRDDTDVARDSDPSCVYFKVKHNSAALVPVFFEDKMRNSRSLKRSSDSACIVFPSKVFRVHEVPVNVFRGHSGDVLDISWSEHMYILSSSTDKTVRLWQVGNTSCLRIFSHTNYVTCVQFNPVDNSYFMSGSIDGKVRIWEISSCRVVDWMDVRDIVTAVCYQPDGMGGVVGTIEGDCRFYDASENHLQLEAKVTLHGKRKSPFNRITGLQFCPTDHLKLLVTSADSQVRILEGFGVISKYKGLANVCSQITASFTRDGQHIISASDDSNVYIWSHSNNNTQNSNPVKVSSYERFYSSNASVAIPWHGIKASSQVSQDPGSVSSQQDRDLIGSRARAEESDFLGMNTLRLPPSRRFILGQEYLPDFLPRGSATWPEERLPSATQALCRSQLKFLKDSFHNTSHEWGRVIVTGGWDGCIRTFQNYGLPVDR